MIARSLILASLLVSASDSRGGSLELPLTNLVAQKADQLPKCLSRFLDYPPGPGKLGFPRCLIGSPFRVNPEFWLKGADFSCVSPWNDSHGRLRAGTAISRRHIIFAKHFPLAPGTRMAFVGVTGEVSHYSVRATKALGKSDIMIGLLDYELTPDVHPAKVLPVGFENWLPPGSKWPVVTFNQNEQALLSEACVTNRNNALYLDNNPSKNPAWQRFGGKIVGGDSGNPAFLIYDDTPIFAYCLFSGGAGNGPDIHRFRSEVQRTMDELCPGYQLDPFDFTSHRAPRTEH